jgi:hypothetical protein
LEGCAIARARNVLCIYHYAISGQRDRVAVALKVVELIDAPPAAKIKPFCEEVLQKVEE